MREQEGKRNEALKMWRREGELKRKYKNWWEVKRKEDEKRKLKSEDIN